jgi:hypothetical protein
VALACQCHKISPGVGLNQSISGCDDGWHKKKKITWGGVEGIIPVEGNITISALSAEMCTNVAASATTAENYSTAVAEL